MTTSATAGGSRAQLTRPDGSALRVLVVDDEPSLCELLSMALRYEGWDVAHRAGRRDRRAAPRASSAPTPSSST